MSGREQKHEDFPVLFLKRSDPADERAEDEDTARLVNRIQAGDREAFAGLYSRYFNRVYSYLRVLLNDRHDAEDAAQEIFMNLLEKLDRYQPRKQPFRAWLFVVVRNHAIDRLRKSERFELLELDENEEALERAEAAVEGQPRLSDFDWINDTDLVLFVERLPLVQRQVLTLYFLLDMTQAEIAKVLGLSHANVRSHQHRALRFLEARLNAVKDKVESKPAGRQRARSQVYRKQAPVLRSRRWSLDP